MKLKGFFGTLKSKEGPSVIHILDRVAKCKPKCASSFGAQVGLQVSRLKTPCCKDT